MNKVTAKTADITPIKEKKDVLKDTPLRALGYADDVAAASIPLVSMSKSGLLRALPGVAYIPAATYMAANVVDKFHKGIDGTGEKPSVKAGLREALYQGVVNVLAPVGIVKCVSKAAKNAPKLLNKLPEKGKEVLISGLEKAYKNKAGKKILDNMGTIGKVATFGASIVALALLSKPADKLTDKVFSKTVDPILLKPKKEKASKEAKEV